MSTSYIPNSDLIFAKESSRQASPFTTFQAGHFVKPAPATQPVAKADNEDLLSFDGEYSDLYVTAALDLDYDEPNAVVEDREVEFVAAGESVVAVEMLVAQPAKQVEVEAIELRDAA